ASAKSSRTARRMRPSMRACRFSNVDCWCVPFGGGIRPIVSCWRRTATALVAVLALVVAGPLERPGVCHVCPPACPMHGQRARAPQRGCHHAATRSVHQADDATCALRATCGHHGAGAPATFHALPRAAVATRPALVVRAHAAPPASRPSRPALAPPSEPP